MNEWYVTKKGDSLQHAETNTGVRVVLGGSPVKVSTIQFISQTGSGPLKVKILQPNEAVRMVANGTDLYVVNADGSQARSRGGANAANRLKEMLSW